MWILVTLTIIYRFSLLKKIKQKTPFPLLYCREVKSHPYIME